MNTKGMNTNLILRFTLVITGVIATTVIVIFVNSFVAINIENESNIRFANSVNGLINEYNQFIDLLNESSNDDLDLLKDDFNSFKTNLSTLDQYDVVEIKNLFLEIGDKVSSSEDTDELKIYIKQKNKLLGYYLEEAEVLTNESRFIR